MSQEPRAFFLASLTWSALTISPALQLSLRQAHRLLDRVPGITTQRGASRASKRTRSGYRVLRGIYPAMRAIVSPTWPIPGGIAAKGKHIQVILQDKVS